MPMVIKVQKSIEQVRRTSGEVGELVARVQVDIAVIFSILSTIKKLDNAALLQTDKQRF